MSLTLDGTNGITFPNASVQNVASVGAGQTWQDVTASRALGTTYTNSTGKPIQISLSIGALSIATFTANLYVNGVLAQNFQISVSSGNGGYFPVTAIVPAGATYQITVTNFTLNKWLELR